jgi:uncharacterized protein
MPSRPRMSEETLEAAWRLLFPDGKPRKGYSIRLGSGEPLLAFDLLKKLQELIDKNGGCAAEGRPAVFLTTNGTRVDGETRDWLVASGWQVKVSLDGPQSVQDRWRVTRAGAGTFAQVSEAVAELARRIPERLSVTAVLCRGTDPREVFQAIAQLGVRRIELVPVAHRDASILTGERDVERYKRFVADYARQRRDGCPAPALVRFENCVRRVMGYDVHRLPCAAGRNFLGVGPGGDLYPCFRFIGLETYRVGRLPQPPDREALFEAGPGRPYEQRTPCDRCWAAPLCGGPCFAVAEMFGAGAGQPLELHCAYTLANATSAVWLVHELRKRDPERLLNFLPAPAKALLPPA